MGSVGEPRSESLRTRVALCVVLALVLPLGLVIAGAYVDVMGGMRSWMSGRSPESNGTVFFVAAAVSGIVLPLVGIAAAVETGQKAARVVLSVVLTITVVSAVVAFVGATTGGVREYDGPPPCVEHSGGDATCPGG